MDPWYPMGSHDMLEVAHMGLHAGQMTGVEEQKACFAAVTENGARVMHLGGYGLKAGRHADLVILQARDVLDALRRQPARLCAIRRGQAIAETTPVTARFTAVGREAIDIMK